MLLPWQATANVATTAAGPQEVAQGAEEDHWDDIWNAQSQDDDDCIILEDRDLGPEKEASSEDDAHSWAGQRLALLQVSLLHLACTIELRCVSVVVRDMDRVVNA